MTSKQREYISLISSLFREFNICKDVADYIGCQFALESAFGESKLAFCYLNHCGMKVPHHRLTIQCGEHDGFGVYDLLFHCVIDYCLWLSFNRFDQEECSSLDLFKAKLQKYGYCPEKDYLSRIDSIYNQFINHQNF